jgi:hypothetical protein
MDLFKRPPMKKEALFKRPPMKKKTLFKRPPIKKEATPKNAKVLVQKISDEKGGNPKKRKGAYSKHLR